MVLPSIGSAENGEMVAVGVSNDNSHGKSRNHLPLAFMINVIMTRHSG